MQAATVVRALLAHVDLEQVQVDKALTIAHLAHAATRARRDHARAMLLALSATAVSIHALALTPRATVPLRLATAATGATARAGAVPPRLCLSSPEATKAETKAETKASLCKRLLYNKQLDAQGEALLQALIDSGGGGEAEGEAPPSPAVTSTAEEEEEEWPMIGGSSGYHRMAGRLTTTAAVTAATPQAVDAPMTGEWWAGKFILRSALPHYYHYLTTLLPHYLTTVLLVRQVHPPIVPRARMRAAGSRRVTVT